MHNAADLSIHLKSVVVSFLLFFIDLHDASPADEAVEIWAQ